MLEVTIEPLGMVSLRGDLTDPRLRAAVEAVAGVPVPDRLRLTGDAARGAAWMSPDEILLFVPRGDGAAAVARLSADLDGLHHLAADVSDLRACLRLRGPAREVLAKLCPADLHPDAFGSGDVRRSRLGQVAAAFWIEEGGARVLCFRSVADYAARLLRRSAQDGPVGFFAAG